MAITVGTSHFVSKSAAVRYYANYGFNAADVERKLAEGEIHLGEPETKEDQIVETVNDEGRYALRDIVTRKAYMADSANLHQAYYVQFVTPAVTAFVTRNIGLETIRKSADKSFNDIPLRLWDALEHGIKARCNTRLLGKAEGYPRGKFGWSLGDAVCIAKAAAREIRGW